MNRIFGAAIIIAMSCAGISAQSNNNTPNNDNTILGGNDEDNYYSTDDIRSMRPGVDVTYHNGDNNNKVSRVC